jgi:probable HAF family extracellular repeat protein
MTDLGTLGGCCSSGAGINSAGQVVGTTFLRGGAFHAFFWDKGVMTDLGTPGGDFIYSQAVAINPAGDVVGWNVDAAQTGARAFLWSKGKMIDLGASGGNYSRAWGINPKGDVVGQSGSGPINFSATLWTRK